jgi:hypothetical protein
MTLFERIESNGFDSGERGWEKNVHELPKQAGIGRKEARIRTFLSLVQTKFRDVLHERPAPSPMNMVNVF